MVGVAIPLFVFGNTSIPAGSDLGQGLLYAKSCVDTVEISDKGSGARTPESFSVVV
jgi:hypothetical protein